jgi:cysteine synthase
MERHRCGWLIHQEVSCIAMLPAAESLQREAAGQSLKVRCPFLCFKALSYKSVWIGIGQGRITNNLQTFIKDVDGALHIADEKSIAMVYDILHNEGLYLGASSSLNVVAAAELATKLGKGVGNAQQRIKKLRLYILGSKIVTVLCDGAYRYQSRLFSKKWLKAKGLDTAIPDHLKKYAVLD